MKIQKKNMGVGSWKLAFCLLTSIACLLSPAFSATIVGDMRSVLDESASNALVNISCLDTPVTFNGHTYLSYTASSQLTNGQLNVTIPPPGRANISFFGRSTSLRVIVPANTNTYDISQMLTNVLVFVSQGISRQILPGAGMSITTNNAGLFNESISLGNIGGVASNVFFLNTSNATWDIAGGSNRVTVSGFEPASANLDLWSAVLPSAYQPLLGYTPATTNFATTAVPGLILPDGVTLVIDPVTKKLSSVATGTGDFVGPNAATSGHVVTFGSGTGKLGSDSGHALSEYTPLSQIASGSQNGVLSSGDWTTFNNKQPALGFTPPTFLQVTQAIVSLTLPIDTLASNGIVTIFGVDQNTNPVPVHIRNNLTITTDGAGGYNLDAAAGGGGGSVSGMVASNYFIVNTNLFIWDVAKVQKLSLNFETNCAAVVVSNSWYLTNGEAQLSTWEDTNGTWKITSLTSSGGLVRTNGNGLWRGTNASQDDEAVIRLDGTGTNVWFTWNTNLQPRIAFTNSLASGGGGGGGGGGSWSLVAHSLVQGTTGDTTVGGLDTTAAKLIYVAVGYTGASIPTLSDSQGNTWTVVTNSTFGGGNPKQISFRCISPIVAAGHTFTVGTVSGTCVSVLAFNAPSTPTADTVTDSSLSGNSGQFSGSWSGSPAKPGIITPAASTSIMISAATWDVGATTPTVDSSFILPDTSGFGPTTGDGLQVAYKIKTADSSSENPAWNGGNGADAMASMIGFH